MDGLTKPTTGELIQWASFKWGIPTEWLDAEYVVESDWHQIKNSDLTEIPCEWYSLYNAPEDKNEGASSKAPCKVFASSGITQIKWVPEHVDPGTEPLRWESTAFNIDYQAANLRYYFDGDCQDCYYFGGGYSPGQEWNSLGAWFEPGGGGEPWGNAFQEEYVGKVQAVLAAKTWEQRGF